MRAIFILMFLALNPAAYAQDESSESTNPVVEETEALEPSNEVLIAASEVGNGRASLLLSERLAQEDLTLSGFYAALAFKEFTPGAADALLNNFEAKEELIEFPANVRLGLMTLRAYQEHPDFAGDLPPETSVQRLPHAAFILTRMGYYQGQIPEVGADLDEDLKSDILNAMHTALQTSDVRGRVERGIGRMADQLTCNQAEKTCS